MNYEWSQYIEFQKAVEKIKKRSSARLLTLVSVGSRGSQETLDELLKQLED